MDRRLVFGLVLIAVGLISHPAVFGLLSVIGETSPIKDCAVLTIDPDRNWNKWGLAIGSWSGYRYRSFISFDLDALYGDVNPDDVDSVELRLYGAAIFPETAKAYVYYVIENWGENTITWNNQPNIARHTFSDGTTVSLLGKLDTIPFDATKSEKGWFSIPFNDGGVRLVKEFLSHGKVLRIVLKGPENIPDAYFYAEDREEKKGAYAPTLALITEDLPALTGRWWINDVEITDETQTLYLTSNTVTFRFAETSGEAATVVVSWTGASTGSVELSKSEGEWTGTATLGDGSYEITLTATDARGTTFTLSIASSQTGTVRNLFSASMIIIGLAVVILSRKPF